MAEISDGKKKQANAWVHHMITLSCNACYVTFLATDQPSKSGNYLKTCFAQCQSALTHLLLAWLLNFVELD